MRDKPKIYTKTGDDGTTGLYGGGRVSKSHPRMEVIGDIDELNSLLGMIQTHLDRYVDSVADRITTIQKNLFILGAQFGSNKAPGVTLEQEDLDLLETWIDETDSDLPPLKNFILPGGCTVGAWCHVARSVCRRAERSIYHFESFLKEILQPPSKWITPVTRAYINRLSDLLFVWARYLNGKHLTNEEPWIPRENSHERTKP